MNITFKPSTKYGLWAVYLAVAFVVLQFLWSFMGPLGAWPAFICGAAAGVLGLIAVIQQKERSALVFLAILPLLFVVFFVVGEFLFPH